MKTSTQETFTKKIKEGYWEVVSQLVENYIHSVYEMRNCSNNKRFTLEVKKQGDR